MLTHAYTMYTTHITKTDSLYKLINLTRVIFLYTENSDMRIIFKSKFERQIDRFIYNNNAPTSLPKANAIHNGKVSIVIYWKQFDPVTIKELLIVGY